MISRMRKRLTRPRRQPKVTPEPARFEILDLATGNWIDGSYGSREELERGLAEHDNVRDLYVYTFDAHGRTLGGFPAGDFLQGHF